MNIAHFERAVKGQGVSLLRVVARKGSADPDPRPLDLAIQLEQAPASGGRSPSALESGATKGSGEQAARGFRSE